MATNDILTPRFMLEVVEHIPIPRNYFAQEYFPTREVTDEELTWDVLKEEQNLAGLYSIDGKIMSGHEAIFGQMFADICRIGAARTVSESEWRKLRDPGMVGIRTGVVGDIRAEIERKIARKLVDCTREVNATMEYLCMNALQGYIPWPPPGYPKSASEYAIGNAVMTVDYNFPADHKIRADNTTVFGTGAALWSDTTNSDPVKAIQVIAEKIEDDAGIPADSLDMIMTRRTVRLMGENTKLRNLMKYTDIAGLLNFGLIARYMEDYLGIRPRIYSAQYTYRTVGTSDPSDITINRIRMLNTNKVLFVPRGTQIGDFATSPAQANNWRPGRFTWRKEEQNPWRMEIGVGINGFPRMIKPECIFVVQVEEDPTGLKSKK